MPFFVGLVLFISAVARCGCVVQTDIDRWRCCLVLELIFLPTERALYVPRKLFHCLTGLCLKSQLFPSSMSIYVDLVKLSG
jgi:hypothetical protein